MVVVVVVVASDVVVVVIVIVVVVVAVVVVAVVVVVVVVVAVVVVANLLISTKLSNKSNAAQRGEGEDLFIVYEGKEATEDVDWVFVLSLEGSSGWMAKDQLRQGDWDKVEEETLTGFTDVMSALDDTRMRRELVGTTRLADILVAENSQDD